MRINETPTEQIWAVLQDHGPRDGGWGTAALAVPGLGGGALVYGGSDERTIAELSKAAITLAEHTGKPTMLSKFTNREDFLVIEGRREGIEI